MLESKKSIIFCFSLFLMLLIVLLFLENKIDGTFFTQIDFIEYHTAFQLFSELKNPYDAKELLILQQALGRISEIPLMMWNPPWLLVILSPVLMLPYTVACIIWLFLNILFVVLALILITKVEQLSLPWNKTPLISALVIFYPMVSCLLLGQLGCFLTLIVACLYYALRKERDILAGFCWFVLSIKPHLFIFLTALLLILLVKTRRYSILLSAGAFLILTLVLIYFINPLALGTWVESQINGVNIPLVPNVTQHKTTTIVYGIRSLLYRFGFGVQNWPFIAIPLIPLGIYLPFVMKEPAKNLLTLDQFFLALMLSFLFCPFGWIFDYVPLILIYYVLIVKRINFLGCFSLKDILLLGLILLNLFSFSLDAFYKTGLHHYVFFAWGIYFLKRFENSLEFNYKN